MKVRASMHKIPLLCCLALVLAGCGLARIRELRADMMKSKTAYTDCLSAHADNPVSCEALRLRFEADARVYEYEDHALIQRLNGIATSPSRSSSSAPVLGPITPDAYGPGISMDATGRPVRSVPWP